MSSSTEAALLAGALDLAQLGYPVIALWPGEKHPWPKHGALDATTSEAGIRQWWAFRPDSGVAIALDKAGLVDVAPDSPERLAEFERRGLPATASYLSGGGEGHRHYLYRRPAGCPITRKCVSGQYDIMSRGLAVVPPSLHPSGRTYQWLTSAMRPEELPEAPAWAVELLQASSSRKVAAGVDEDDEDGPPVRLTGEALTRWRGELADTAANGVVDRSQSLWQIAVDLATAGATVRTIAAALEDRDDTLGWAKYAGRRDAEERYRETARRALDFVLRRPHAAPVADQPAAGECAGHVETIVKQGRFISQFGEVLRNQNLSTTQRVVALVASFELFSAQSRQGEGPHALYREAIGEKAGVSADTAGKALEALSAAGGVFEKVTGYERVEVIDRVTGEVTELPRKVCRFRPRFAELGESLRALAQYTPEDKKLHGGKREPRCPDHPEAGTVERRIVCCKACGRHLGDASLYTQHAAVKYVTSREAGNGESLYGQDAAIGTRRGSKRCRVCREGLLAHERIEGICSACAAVESTVAGAALPPEDHPAWWAGVAGGVT